MPANHARLTPSFIARWRGPTPEDSDALERTLADLHARGHRAFPDVGLNAADLAAYAGERARPLVAAHEAVGELHAEDLFLACACAHALPAALRAFDRTLIAKIPTYLRKLRPSSELVDETRQALLERLFVPSAGQPPKIAQYSGRGALEGWVRVAALRVALDLLAERRPAAFDEDAALAGAVAPSNEPDLLFVKAAYRGPFLAAFRESLAELPRRDRALLRLAFVERLTPERIGKLYDVHRTTAMRWLDAARAAVLARTRAILVERLRLSPSECDGLVEAVRSNLDVTLSSLLRADA